MTIPFLTAKVITILTIIGVTLLALMGVQFLGRVALRAVRNSEKVDEERRSQMVTVVGVIKWILRVLILGIAVLMVLNALGVNIGPLLAGAGVLTLAVSLGAQGLVKDSIGGLLILVENQYAIGDSIQVGAVSGEVARITLRATYLRAGNGDLIIVPNGEVRVVANQTKTWSRASVELGIAYEEDIERVLRTLEEAANEFAQDPEFAPHLLEPPQVLGPMSLGDWAFNIQVRIKTLPGEQWAVARELRRALLAACDRESITLPYPRQEILLGNVSGESAALPAGE